MQSRQIKVVFIMMALASYVQLLFTIHKELPCYRQFLQIPDEVRANKKGTWKALSEEN